MNSAKPSGFRRFVRSLRKQRAVLGLLQSARSVRSVDLAAVDPDYRRTIDQLRFQGFRITREIHTTHSGRECWTLG